MTIVVPEERDEGAGGKANRVEAEVLCVESEDRDGWEFEEFVESWWFAWCMLVELLED